MAWNLVARLRQDGRVTANVGEGNQGMNAGISRRPERQMARRSFLKSLVGEAMAFYEELHGRPQLRLAELDRLPDETLAKIMPVVAPDIEIIATEDQVSARRAGQEKIILCFKCEPANQFVFNRFNGLTPLGDIGGELAAAMAWDKQAGFAHAKSLFLHLVRLGVCMPSNAIG